MKSHNKSWLPFETSELQKWAKRIFNGTETYYRACKYEMSYNHRSFESNRSKLKKMVAKLKAKAIENLVDEGEEAYKEHTSIY